MPEQRARKHHQDRVAETLRDEIGIMLEGELSDPRIGLAHVTEVVLNPGGKSARVYVALQTSEQDLEREEQQTVEALTAARTYIRRELLSRMGVRHVPELSFHIDRTEHASARIDELLHRAKKRQARGGAA
jgi:ribosome-binding factor A